MSAEQTILISHSEFHVSGACEFPVSWKGKWFQYGRETPVIVNATVLGGRSCIERNKPRSDMFIVYEQ